MKKQITKICEKAIAKVVYEKAKREVNSTCTYVMFQPVIPKKVQKLKTNNEK